MHRVTGLAAAIVLTASMAVAQDAEPPNILVIWGDDIGTWNISHNNRGMMGYETPNIDRIAEEGLGFTDYYGQQSCTAGRAAFIGGNVPVRTGMTKVGLPGAEQGWQASDVTMATVLKSQGYRTGQFGKNHQGDRNEFLPTVHGFDEFFGNLYHLNAEEEPENRDFPGDMVLANGKTFKEQFGPRGVIHSWATDTDDPTEQPRWGKIGKQRIEDTGPLTKKRMETVDQETADAAKAFIRDAVASGEPFFVWWNATRMHFRTHVSEEHTGLSGPDGDEYHRRHGRARHAGRPVPRPARRAWHRRQHGGDVLDRQRPALQYLARRRHHPLPQSRRTRTGRAPIACRPSSAGPATSRPGETRNGIVAHEDWLPTFAAIAGNPDIKAKLREGVDLEGTHYRNYIDGYDLTDYLAGDGEDPRKEFWYVNDDGQVVAARYDAWKVVFLENRGQAFGVWREPFTELRVPLLFNLRRDPFEKAQHDSNTYNDWFLDHAFVLVPIQTLAAQFLQTMQEYPPSQRPGSFNLTGVEETIKNGLGNWAAALQGARPGHLGRARVVNSHPRRRSGIFLAAENFRCATCVSVIWRHRLSASIARAPDFHPNR